MLPFRHPGDQTHQFRPNVKGAPSAHQVALKLSIAPKDQLQCYPELVDDLPTPGQHKRAKFPTSKAPLSAVFHSFRLIFGRAIISRNGLEAWMLFYSTRARGTLTLKRR